MLAAYPDAWWLGLTATPQRTDRRGLAEHYDAMVIAATPRELADAGHLAEPRVFAPADPDVSGVRTVAGDYHQGQLGAVMLRPELVGDIVATWQRRAAGMRTLVFCSGIAHSQAVRDAFLTAGVRAAHVDGSTPPEERADLLAAVAAGRIEVLCNVGIAAEGVDIPALECVVLARPTQSLTVYLQAVGRVLRPQGRACIVLDHAGCLLQHGHPLRTRPWALYESAADAPIERVTPIYQCAACAYATDCRFAACPACGRERSATKRWPAARRGELVEVDGGGGAVECSACGGRDIREWPRGAQRLRRCGDFAAFLGAAVVDGVSGAAVVAEWARIQAQARERGYRPGWAYHRFRARFGHPPPRAGA